MASISVAPTQTVAGGLGQLPQRRSSGRSTRAVVGRRTHTHRLVCRAQQERDEKVNFLKSAARKMATAGAAVLLSFSSVSPMAIANEFDILGEEVPSANFVIDDAGVLSKAGMKSLNNVLKTCEIKTGYRITAITTRKLEFESDAFAFADKVLENWYPTAEIGDKKGIVLIVTTSKDGAVTGGPAFMNAVGDDLIDSIISDNIPILTSEELYNEAVTSTVKRLDAKLSGEQDPGPPSRKDTTRKRTYKTKSETDNAKGVTSTVVLSLLLIAFVVPMLQFYGYVSKD